MVCFLVTHIIIIVAYFFPQGFSELGSTINHHFGFFFFVHENLVNLLLVIDFICFAAYYVESAVKIAKSVRVERSCSLFLNNI